MSQAQSKILDVKAIEKILPHRYPFLLVDKVISYEAGKAAYGIKSVSMNEWFFQGHFPQEPVMPGVLIIEALAQLSGIAMLAESEQGDGQKSMYFVKINNATFKGKVVPGDSLHLYTEQTRCLANMYFFKVHAKVDEKIVAEAEIVATVG